MVESLRVARSAARVCLLMTLVLSGSLSTKAEDPTLEDVWSGKARFEVEQIEFGAEFGMHFLSAIADQETVHVFYNLPDAAENSIGLAMTTDGMVFKNVGKVVTRSPIGWDSRFAAFPGIAKVDQKWFLAYEGAGSSPGDIGLATSDDGTKFSKETAPILVHARRQPKDPAGVSLAWERVNIGTPSIYVENGVFYVFYHGFGKSAHGGPDDCQLGLATGTDLTKLKRSGSGPLIRTSKSGWDSGTIGKRSIVKQNEYYYMVFEGSTDQPYNKANWSSGLARAKAITGPWEKFDQNPVLPVAQGRFGYDGPEWIKIGPIQYIYFRSPAGPTSRAALVWK